MLAVAAASFCALGFAVTAVIPNADAAAPIVNATILPLLFLSGILIPLGDNAPAWITFRWRDVLVVAASGLAGLVLATRYFSWEPRT